MAPEEKQAEKAAEKKDEARKREADKKEELKEQAVIAIRDISIALDTYDDIYSDFDPRPHAEREISADLLKELERRTHTDVKGNFEIRFFMPKALRDEKAESRIIRRLRTYFLGEVKDFEQKDKRRRRSGINFMVAGLAALFGYAYIANLPEVIGQLASFIEVLLVPFGWFSMWVGLERLVQEKDAYAHELDFYQKLSKANYMFLSEEDNMTGATQEPAEGAQAK
ncbi:MAG: hypothetical protein Q7T16_04625 [Candidatus Burarchaeum sp.]|nr:hypothetical protein [Candidatus Burarchaeum sp.]MDO8339913.1 hypothetical protein [Candidatus Burarchaeum sp.]